MSEVREDLVLDKEQRRQSSLTECCLGYNTKTWFGLS